MKKQAPFPHTRLILDSVPAEAIGLSQKTLLRRRKHPGKVTLEELQKVLRYKTAQGEMPIELLRELIRRDLSS